MRRHTTRTSPKTRPVTAQPARLLEHALQQHHAELELQNGELRRTQVELAAAHVRNLDLYHLAPVGYFTLDMDGRILEVNRTGAAMLGMAPLALKGHALGRFVMAGDNDRWQQYLQHVAAADGLQRMDLALATPDGRHWYGQIDSLRTPEAGGTHALRVTLAEITERLRGELDRRMAALDNDAREAERRRVALELHENLGQMLSALKLDVSHLAHMNDSAACRNCASRMLEALDAAVYTVRRLTADLHPPMLDDLGLNAAIDWLANDTARRMGLQLSLALGPESPPLAPATALAVYRFVQAALSHLLHNTDSTDVHLDLQRQPDMLKLTMQARGAVGPLTEHTAAQTHGRQILQHRSRLLGGRLVIDTARNSAGWRGLCLTLPMTQDDQGRCHHTEALA